MGGEIFSVAVIIPTLVMVGLGLGYLLLRVAPDD
ncbi:MAG: PetM family cytochrome b6-f complex subunit 7 [Leptolyngbyaceae cyanobacterium MO_188.B28]|nr:PetM family cytochrome b6-f complex subunit 7 [Leptolyngbyaceae cyanobacterium MO_188.B28]